jgi:Spy/CpxP family protein refolding chaperone
MKKILTGALAFVLFAGAAQAQTKDSSWHHNKGGQHTGMKQLNLTEDQKAKLKAIHDRERQEMKSLNTGSVTSDQSKAKRQELHKKYKAEIESVLTAEQRQQMQKMHADRKAGKNGKGKNGKDFSKRGDFQKQLNLTQAQQDKMAELRKSSKSQFESIKNDKSLTDSQKKEKFQAIRKQQQEEMKSILTKEQLEKMQSFRKDRKPETK